MGSAGSAGGAASLDRPLRAPSASRHIRHRRGARAPALLAPIVLGVARPTQRPREAVPCAELVAASARRSRSLPLAALSTRAARRRLGLARAILSMQTADMLQAEWDVVRKLGKAEAMSAQLMRALEAAARKKKSQEDAKAATSRPRRADD